MTSFINVWKTSSVGYYVLSEKHIPHNVLCSGYFGNVRQRLTWGVGVCWYYLRLKYKNFAHIQLVFELYLQNEKWKGKHSDAR